MKKGKTKPQEPAQQERMVSIEVPERLAHTLLVLSKAGLNDLMFIRWMVKSVLDQPEDHKIMNGKKLVVSEDCRLVVKEGVLPWRLSKTQAKVFEVLLEAYLKGHPALTEERIFGRIGHEGGGRLIDAFRGKPGWRKWITDKYNDREKTGLFRIEPRLLSDGVNWEGHDDRGRLVRDRLTD